MYICVYIYTLYMYIYIMYSPSFYWIQNEETLHKGVDRFNDY